MWRRLHPLIYLFLSHDVDWPRSGAPLKHIMARRERFDEQTLRRAATKNPYYNIPELMNIEERMGVRSTFFFRVKYRRGVVEEYEEDLKALVKGGWEIGLHSDPSSLPSLEAMAAEKARLERLTGVAVKGNRTHYLVHDVSVLRHLGLLELHYDSSLHSGERALHPRDFGFLLLNGMIEFPVSLMDTYLFSYMKVREDSLLEKVQEAVEMCTQLPQKPGVMTLLWHNCSLRMVGGRMYPRVLEHLLSLDKVCIMRGIDLAERIKKDSSMRANPSPDLLQHRGAPD